YYQTLMTCFFNKGEISSKFLLFEDVDSDSQSHATVSTNLSPFLRKLNIGKRSFQTLVDEYQSKKKY
ncbi:hypothetical protein HMI55_005675, partial [Coelomomyces lativittatus]